MKEDRLPQQPQVVWEKAPQHRRLGLVLSGGAGRGMAHIGVLQVLEAAGLQPTHIVGTSVGALVGGLYAAGVSPDRLAQMAQELRWKKIAGISIPRMGLLDMDRLIELVDDLIGPAITFEDLPISFAAVAADIVSSEVVVLNQGAIAPAIRASCSVPGIFTPVRRKGRLLVDGGILNNLPVSIAQDLGADYIVAVDLLPVGSLMGREPQNLLEITLSSLYTLIRATHRQESQADLVIIPEIAHISLADLSAYAPLIQAGRAATEAVVTQIKAAMGRSD